MSNAKDNVVDLEMFRNKKLFDEAIAKGRVPLYSGSLEGQLKGSPHLNANDAQNEPVAERIKRIRTSLDKINFLMGELKKNMKNEGQD